MKADSIRYPVVQNIRMTNNIRVFLWLGLALALWINYSQWQIDYGAKALKPVENYVSSFLKLFDNAIEGKVKVASVIESSLQKQAVSELG